MAAQETTRESPDQMRFQRADRVLQSAAYMVAVERAVDALDVPAPPALTCFAGGRQLRSARRIGLFAGSYNPLTCAHVTLADVAREQAQLDDIVWALSRVTVDKERVSRASLPDRLAQLVAFARPRRETVALLNRGLYVDQVEALRSVAPSDARIFVLVGYDKVVQIFDPHYYTDREAALAALFAHATLLVAPRDAFGASDLAELLARPENAPFASHVAVLAVPPDHLHDSSTEVRQLAAEPIEHRDAVGRLVPPEALALIVTGAYAPAIGYTVRQDWLAALTSLPASELRRVPPITQLVTGIQALPNGPAALRSVAARASAQTTMELLRTVKQHDTDAGAKPS